MDRPYSGEKFICIIFNIFRGNCDKNKHFPLINIILPIYDKTVARKKVLQNIFLDVQITSCHISSNLQFLLCGNPRNFVQTQGSDYWQLIHLLVM